MNSKNYWHTNFNFFELYPKIHCKWTEMDIRCQWHLPDKPTKPLAVLGPDLRFMMKECNGVVL